MQRLVHLQGEKQICDLLSKMSPYMFTPLEERGQGVKEYAGKLSQHAEVYVAEINGKEAGMIAFYCNDRSAWRAYLAILVVEDTYRKRGIATSLLNQMFQRCWEEKMKMIELEVNRKNLAAISLYKKHGFHMKKENGESGYMEKEVVVVDD